MVPETCLRFGPAVVVNLAESEFSGNKEFLSAPRPMAVEVCSSPSASTVSFLGTSIP